MTTSTSPLLANLRMNARAKDEAGRQDVSKRLRLREEMKCENFDW